MPAIPAQFDPPFPETKLKPGKPGGRRPLHHDSDDEENFQAEQYSPGGSDRREELAPVAPDECCGISTDEDDSYETEEEVSKTLSSEQLLSSVRARRASKPPSPPCDHSQRSRTPANLDLHREKAPSLPCERFNLRKFEPVSRRDKRFIAIVVVVAILIVPSLTYVWMPQGPTETPERDRFADFAADLREIILEFPKQDRRCWSDIRAAMEDLVNTSSKPWTFLLLSNDSATVTRLAELLGEASSKALRAKNSLILKPEDMGNEYGDTIDRLLPRILENKAVVVHDLLNVDPGAVQAFHTMCDRENPLVKEAVYIITIIAPGYAASMKAEAFVENLLLETFANGVHEDKLQPLVTRLTDGPVIPVV